jgi:hypothetical protein
MSLLPPRVVGPISECTKWVTAHHTVPGAVVTIEAQAPDGSKRTVGESTTHQTTARVRLDVGQTLNAGDQVNAYQDDGADASKVSTDGPVVQESVSEMSPVQALTRLTRCGLGLSLGGMRPGTEVEVHWQGGPIGSGVAHEGVAHVKIHSGLPGPLPAGALRAHQRVCPKPPPPPPASSWVMESDLPEVLPSPLPAGARVPPPTILSGLSACSRAVEVADILPGAEVILEGRDRGWFIALGAGDHSTATLHLPVSLTEGEPVVARQVLGYRVCRVIADEDELEVGPREPDARPQLMPVSCARVPVLWANLLRTGADIEFEVATSGVPTIHRTVVVDKDQPLPAPPMADGDVVRLRQGGCGEWSEWSEPQTVQALTADLTVPRIPHELFACQDQVEVENISPLIGILRVMSDQRGELARVVPTAEAMAVAVAPSLSAGHEVWVEREGCGLHAESERRVVRQNNHEAPGVIAGPLYDGDTEVIVEELVAGARVEIWDASPDVDVLLTSAKAPSSDTGRVDARFTGFGELQAGMQVYAKTSYCGHFERTDHVAVGFRSPKITGISPPSIMMGSPGLTLKVSGRQFTTGAVVLWKGQPRPTTYHSRTEVRAAISASDLTTAEAVEIKVRIPDGQTTEPFWFYVMSPVPPPPQGYDELVIMNCNTNFIPGTNIHREVHIYFRLATGGVWTPIHDSPHAADYNTAGTCAYSPGAGARFALDDGKEYEVVAVDRYLYGCNTGHPDEPACRRSEVWRVRGKAGGGERVVYVN